MASPLAVAARRVALALSGAAVLAALSGCAGAGACSTMHVGDGFPILVTGVLAPHPSLQLCLAGTCSSRMVDRNGASEFVRGGGTTMRVSRITPGHWYAVVERGPDPASVAVAIGPGAARTVPLSWRRAPESDSCVSWRTAGTVRVALP